MLGKLGGTIAKSKKHPEKSLVNRYHLSVAAGNPLQTGDAVADEPHPLVPLGGVDAGGDQPYEWPRSSCSNRKKDPRSGGESANRQRILEPILGDEVCSRFSGRNSDLSLFTFKTAIRIGRWKFNCRLREEAGAQTNKTRSSWFSIRARHVPHLSTSAVLLDPTSGLTVDTLVYGRIEQFAELTVPHWRGNPWHLADVFLYKSQGTHPATKHPIIHLNEPLVQKYKQDFVDRQAEEQEFYRRKLQNRWIRYVQVRHIVNIVAVAPCQAVGNASRKKLFVLPLDV